MSTTEDPKHIVLVGCGKMGGALLRGWLNSDMAVECTIIAPNAPKHPDLLESPHVRHVTSPAEAADALAAADAIVLGVKPQKMQEVCEGLKPYVPEETLVISIAAGKSIASFENIFGAGQPVVRAMPNTPASIDRGITVAVPSGHVCDEQRSLADTLLRATGDLEWTHDESLMNAVTALSGSGPAYIFFLIEVLEQAGKEIGLPPELAAKLALKTVIGSAALADAKSDTPVWSLREQVTSPGGTTAAALGVLMDGRFQDLFTQALTAAVKRGIELNGQAQQPVAAGAAPSDHPASPVLCL